MKKTKTALNLINGTFFIMLSTMAVAQVDQACVGKHISPDKPNQQSNGEYMFENQGYGSIATTLIQRQQYTVISAKPMDGGKWCLATIEVNGQVNGNSFNSVLDVGAF